MDPNKFEVISRLGSGAFATVFKERYAPDGTYFAVKVLTDVHSNNPQTAAALATAQREARVLMLCDHPNIIKYYATLQRDNGERMYVLELCDGGNLRTMLTRKRTFPVNCARYIAYEIAMALNYLHEGEKRTQPNVSDAPRKKVPILHRDVKMENIVFTEKRHVKLVDFGTVSNVDEPAAAANTFVGTIEYMSPEVHGGNPATAASDFWSLGVILYEMLTGQRPFSSASQFETIEMIMSEAPKFPPGFDPAAEDLIKRLLHKTPEGRLYGPVCLEHPFFAPWVQRLAAEGKLTGDWNSVDVSASWVKNADWVKDESAKSCYLCSKEFGLFRRKHHCRNCGNLACSECSENMVLIPDSTYTGRERCCDDCYNLLTTT